MYFEGLIQKRIVSCNLKCPNTSKRREKQFGAETAATKQVGTEIGGAEAASAKIKPSRMFDRDYLELELRPVSATGPWLRSLGTDLQMGAQSNE
uniref:Uncharacterized protein n=1 Tax=Romanomermis culicivorax TaxID=13658 RepID=A0A915IZK9_ROMCU